MDVGGDIGERPMDLILKFKALMAVKTKGGAYGWRTNTDGS
jgi:hypothetical protein